MTVKRKKTPPKRLFEELKNALTPAPSPKFGRRGWGEGSAVHFDTFKISSKLALPVTASF
jgi:hypothetical protein